MISTWLTSLTNRYTDAQQPTTNGCSSNSRGATATSSKFDLKDYKGKVLTNPKTGDEICFIIFGLDKYMLDAKYFISAGRRLSEMSEEEKQELLGAKVEGEWNEKKQEFTQTADCGTAFGEFLEKKANKIK